MLSQKILRLYHKYLKQKTILFHTDGATAIEYALIAFLIAVGLIASLTDIGTTIAASFNSITNAF